MSAWAALLAVTVKSAAPPSVMRAASAAMPMVGRSLAAMVISWEPDSPEPGRRMPKGSSPSAMVKVSASSERLSSATATVALALRWLASTRTVPTGV